MKGFSSKCIALKVVVIQSQKIYCLQGCPCTFNPEILQAGAVKGLKRTQTKHASKPLRKHRGGAGMFMSWFRTVVG